MNFDPFGIGTTFLKLQQSWLSHPAELKAEQRKLALDMWLLNLNALLTMAGGNPPPAVAVADEDERFADPAWLRNPFHCLLVQHYLLQTRWLERVVYDTPGASKEESRKGAFWVRQWFNALAPSNFLFSNPAAMQKAWQSHGATLFKGVENMLADLKANDLQMVDKRPFAVGKNLAPTPGTVVFRNELIEVIQYHPLAEKVHAVPILLVPPWINKFYVLDLNREKSLVRHLLSQGFSVFIVSWKNPTAAMADTGFETYLQKGVLAAIDVARAVCQAPQVHAVGYCIGGTALATLMAWLNRKYEDAAQVPVAHWTLLASLVDFSRPGEIDTFINPESFAMIDTLMDKQGYLDKSQISWSFRMLRPNSLIWHYVVHKYLYGETPPPFDVLFWNSDSTRLPRAMHRFCLRNFYRENKLPLKDALVLNSYPIDFSRVTQPLYAVGAAEDHITPWRGTFKTAGLVRGPVRYVLSTSGHILGIVNPPSQRSKREYWVGNASGATEGKSWRAAQTKMAGSWWGDWDQWLHERCGPLQTPPAIGSTAYPALCAAPGTYVHET